MKDKIHVIYGLNPCKCPLWLVLYFNWVAAAIDDQMGYGDRE